MTVTHDLSILSLISQASVLVQLVMALLAGLSFVSWYWIFRKWFRIREARTKTVQFERDFWSGGDLGTLYEAASSSRHRTGGMERIFEHERLLTRRAHEVLAEVPGLRILGPAPELTGGIVSFVLDRPHAHDVAQLLDRRGIAIRAGHHCAMPLHKRLGISASNRASFYFYNTLEEVEQLGAALQEIRKFFVRKGEG